jgi:hypothetical protein
LAANALVQRRGASYHVTLQTEHEGRRGARTLEASECRTLVRTVTLVLALAFGAGVEIEPSAAPEDRPASDTPSEPAPMPASAPSAAESEPSFAAGSSETATDADPEREDADEPDSPGPALSLAWLLGLGGTANLMPRAGLLASTGPELRLGALSLGMRALFWPGVATVAGPGIRAHWLALGGALMACGHTALTASLELAACGGGRVVAIRANATGDVRGATATAPWTALTSSVSMDWPSAHWLRARLELGLSLSLSRPNFLIEDLGNTHRIPPLIPEATASARATF